MALSPYLKKTLTMRILILGSQNFSDFDLVRNTFSLLIDPLSNPEDVTIVHGNARGADRVSGFIAKEKGYQVEAHEPNWNLHGKKAGPIRTQQMIDQGFDQCIVFAYGSDMPSLTNVEKTGKPVTVILGKTQH